MLLDEQIVALEGAFLAAGIPHAFGGAHALAYYGSVRATRDIDVNVFLPVSEVDRVFGVLEGLGASVGNPGLKHLARRDEQVGGGQYVAPKRETSRDQVVTDGLRADASPFVLDSAAAPEAQCQDVGHPEVRAYTTHLDHDV